MNEGADTKDEPAMSDDLDELRSIRGGAARPSSLASVTAKMKRTRWLHGRSRVFVWALSAAIATYAAVSWWRDRSSRSLVGLVGVAVILVITLGAWHRLVRGVGSGVDLAAGAMLDRLETNVRGELRLSVFLRRFVLITVVVLEAVTAWMTRDRWRTSDVVVAAFRSLALSAAVVAFVLVVTENAQRRARVALRSLEQTRRELLDDDDGGGVEDELAAPALAAPDARGLRLVEVLVFVFVWMCAGFALRPGAEVYLLIGVPLTVYFQLAVARRPLRELWVKKADRSPEMGRVRLPRLLAATALFALLWGIWHLPLLLTTAVPVTLGSVAVLTLYLAAVHVPVGLVLSRYYRRTGNLLVPGVTHSFIDAVRDALLS